MPRRATAAAFESEPDESLDHIVWGDAAGRAPAATAVVEVEPDGLLGEVLGARSAGSVLDREDHEAAALLGAWIDDLSAHLRLDDLHRKDVAAEIGDHLADEVARLEKEGLPPAKAAAASIAGLGPVDDLARVISAAHHGKRRLARGLFTGLVVAGGTALITFTVSVLVLYAVIAAVEAVLPAMWNLGIHVWVDDTAELKSQEIAVSGCLAAFVAGRRSTTSLAIHSRFAESSSGPAWGLAGAAVLLLVALVVPLPLHPLSFATLLLIPLFFIAGSLRPQRIGSDLAPVPWRAVAVAVVIAATVVPGFHSWAYDPHDLPAAAAPFASSPPSATFVWERSRNSDKVRVQVMGLDGVTWRDPRVELWPTVREGLAIVPLRTATKPALSVAGADRFSLLPVSRAYPELLVTVSAVGPDGARHTIHGELQLGWPTHSMISIFDWLTGHR